MRFLCADFSTSYESILTPAQKNEVQFVWEIESPSPFNEAIVSWNGIRPEIGKWTVFVSLRQGEWSPWLKYAEWSPSSQRTFKSSPENSFAETYQDCAAPKRGTSDAIRIKVIAEEGADLSQMDSIYACLSDLSKHTVSPPLPLLPVLLKEVPPRSQMALNHPRNKDMCSPTSTTVAIRYLSGRLGIDPLSFAKLSHDDEFDIYGNWILNTAEAYQQLEGSFRAHVERCNDFSKIHSHLLEGIPSVVSVKGAIPGAPLPYDFGHLICIIGYDPLENKVHCVDPAFPSDESTRVCYPMEDFLKAWGLRRNLAYLFQKK